MLRSLACLCCGAIVFSSQLAEACAFSWLCPAGCVLRSAPAGPFADLSEPPRLGDRARCHKKGTSGSGNGVVKTMKKSFYGQKGLLATMLPNSRGGLAAFRVWSVHPESGLKGTCMMPWPHLSICLTPQNYLTATLDMGGTS